MRRGGPALAPGAQWALTGFGVDSVLLPVNLQAKVVHGAVGQQPTDGQFQQQGQQGLGPDCRARQLGVSWEQGCRAAAWGCSRARAEVTWRGRRE